MAESHEVEKKVNVQIIYQTETLDFELPPDATFQDLAAEFADTIQADLERVTLYCTPKPGYLKYPFSTLTLKDVLTSKTRIKGVGTPTKDVNQLDRIAERAVARRQAREQAQRIGRETRHSQNRDWRQIQADAMYTFHTIEPLKYLPNPEKSRRYLERLARDPGIKASMRKHGFSVGLLTEMNPAEHTTHESKTLGLNRNKGEVIELRLRTDAYDGYRDYKVIRKTLCHELAHNVHSEHDRNFWDLTKEIEKEVDQNDFLHGGHKLTSDEFFNPDDEYEDDHADTGGWKGGEFVLGGTDQTAGLSRRDVIARAALSRLEKRKEAEDQQNAPGSGTGT